MRAIVLVLVLAARASPYPALIRTIKRTWGAVRIPRVDVLYYYGGSHHVADGSELVLPVPDDLAHTGAKTIAAFDYALRHREFDLVFRTNCSSYVDLPNLHDYVAANATPHQFYAGRVGTHGSIPFASGSGDFLSRDLVELVVEKQRAWDHSALDDVALGALLNQEGVRPASAPRQDYVAPVEPHEVNTSHFHFRCKTSSRHRRADIELLLAIHRAFCDERGLPPVSDGVLGSARRVVRRALR